MKYASNRVEYVRNHPLIPDHVTVSGWVYEVETGRLRPPHERLGASGTQQTSVSPVGISALEDKADIPDPLANIR
jgi:hypothetical protein